MMENNLKVGLNTLRNSGILGQEVFYIKNRDFIWALRNKEDNLWGKMSYDKGMSWSDWKRMINDYNGYFSFTICHENKLHIACKNKNGFIVYISWQIEDLLVKVLDKKWLQDERLTYQTIFVDMQERINLIYFTENPLEETWEIKHCFYKAERWSLPEIIDHGLGPGQSQGAVAINSLGVINLVYQIFSKAKYRLVLKEKAPDQPWQERVFITDATRSNMYPCLVIDQNNTLHLTWIRSDGMNYRVVYRQKTKGGWMVGGWRSDKILSSEGINAYTPSIGIIDNEKIVVLWQQVDGIYQSISNDGGKTFDVPTLNERYQKLTNKNIIAIDMYQKKGLNTMTSFDTGSTSIALLAIAYQGDQQEVEKEAFLQLPDAQEKQDLMLSNMEYLSLDYGQRGLTEHLKRINGNFHQLLVETEDVRLTNMQMQETIVEKSEVIEKLYEDISKNEQEIINLNEKHKTLEGFSQSQKKNFIKRTSELNSQKRQIENKLKALEADVNKLQAQIASKENANKELKKMLSEKENLIKILKNNENKMRKDLEDYKKTPIWKKIF